jgi:hypothetical protein
MNKKLKLGLLFGVPVLIGAYLIYRQFNPKGAVGKYIPPPTPKPEVTPVPSPTSSCNYPLKKGVYNCDLVKQLQWALNHIPYTKYDSTTNLVKYRPLKEDGDFGEKTQAVLIDFWNRGSGSNGEVLNQSEMDLILSYVIEDPAAFQAAENPYVVAPTPAPEPTFNPFPTFP